MSAVRHFCLGCCLLCAAAGMIRIFWPENHFKPVINSVLLLYIVASVLPMARHTDWNALGRELRGWVRSGTSAGAETDYTGYAEALGQAAAAAALQARLAENGIEAHVTFRQDGCTVTLAPGADAALARELAQAACGQLPCQVLQTSAEGGGQP